MLSGPGGDYRLAEEMPAPGSPVGYGIFHIPRPADRGAQGAEHGKYSVGWRHAPLTEDVLKRCLYAIEPGEKGKSPDVATGHGVSQSQDREAGT